MKFKVDFLKCFLKPSINVPSYVYDVLQRKEKKTLGGTIFDMSKLTEEFERRLKDDPKNIWGRITLAQAYHKGFNHKIAFEHYLKAAKQNPKIADPLIGLGNIYYDLALYDMIDRKLTRQSSEGFIFFNPDEKAKMLLLESKRLF